MSRLTPKSATLFARILDKDLRAGIGVKLINEVYPNLIPEAAVMLAETYDPTLCIWPMWVSPKINGNRATYAEKRFFSRSGKLIHGLEHLIAGLEKYNISMDLDGELRDPNVSFEQSSGMVRRGKSNKAPMEYYVFDLPDESTTANARYMRMDFMSWPPNVFLVKHALAYTHKQVMSMYDTARSMGFEGVVVKRYGHLYQAGKHYDWLKIKPIEQVDLEVESLLPGKGKFHGSLGKIVVNYKGKPVKVSPAISDELRQFYWDNPHELLGHTVEVLFQEQTSAGSLRHPRFEIVRRDK
jgi:DNA ligase-1